MAQGSCGCKGIRHCLLCEPNMKIDNHREKEPRAFGSSFFRPYHYCLHSKSVNPGRWKTCECSANFYEFASKETSSANDECLIGDLELDNDIIILENFVTKGEQLALKEEIYKLPWKLSQSGRRKQDFGPKANFKRKKAKIGKFSGLPSFSKIIVERMQSTSGLESFVPVEVCHLEYIKERGSCIDPHIDDRWLWGERLVTLSLCSASILTLSKDNKDVFIQIPMPPCSLLVIKGAARHEWKHEVKREDICDIRIAVTFRELSREFTHGNFSEVGKEILDIAKNFNGKPLYSQ